MGIVVTLDLDGFLEGSDGLRQLTQPVEDLALQKVCLGMVGLLLDQPCEELLALLDVFVTALLLEEHPCEF